MQVRTDLLNYPNFVKINEVIPPPNRRTLIDGSYLPLKSNYHSQYNSVSDIDKGSIQYYGTTNDRTYNNRFREEFEIPCIRLESYGPDQLLSTQPCKNTPTDANPTQHNIYSFGETIARNQRADQARLNASNDILRTYSWK